MDVNYVRCRVREHPAQFSAEQLALDQAVTRRQRIPAILQRDLAMTSCCDVETQNVMSPRLKLGRHFGDMGIDSTDKAISIRNLEYFQSDALLQKQFMIEMA